MVLCLLCRCTQWINHYSYVHGSPLYPALIRYSYVFWYIPADVCVYDKCKQVKVYKTCTYSIRWTQNKWRKCKKWVEKNKWNSVGMEYFIPFHR